MPNFLRFAKNVAKSFTSNYDKGQTMKIRRFHFPVDFNTHFQDIGRGRLREILWQSQPRPVYGDWIIVIAKREVWSGFLDEKTGRPERSQESTGDRLYCMCKGCLPLDALPIETRPGIPPAVFLGTALVSLEVIESRHDIPWADGSTHRKAYDGRIL